MPVICHTALHKCPNHWHQEIPWDHAEKELQFADLKKACVKKKAITKEVETGKENP